ncbi:MAG: sulfotransferase domain-containing protein [Actinobacteria bacterium]|nr:sulfotransferase domain-containing protein [Actinomycetota bacterium]
MPDFLVIGAQRCGTSSLYMYLSRHPHVLPSLRKEIEYFSTRYQEGEAWYRAHFPLEVRMASGRHPSQTFEATPDYLLHPEAPGRAARLIPAARLILLVRDPVTRAYSHYQHNRRLGQEPLSFEDALDQEEPRLASEAEKIRKDPSYQARPLRRYSYATRGRYAEQLERWLAHFEPEQVLILGSNDLFGQTAPAFDRIQRFLGLPAWQPPRFRNYSYLGRPDSPLPPLQDALRRRLAREFAEPNQRFYDLVGKDFGWQT